MRIAEFFGKGRRSRENPQVQDEPPGDRDDAVGAASGRSETPGPRMEATDAPSSLARAGSAVAVAPRPVPGPAYEEIAARAYDLWLSQGRPEGRERDNWIEAERQLHAERAIVG